jgi:hypothetical protein
MANHVCRRCIGNYPLQELIGQEATANKCDYCDAVSTNGPIAASIKKLMPRISEGLQTEWADPGDEAVPWDSEEGRYIAPVYDSYDLLEMFVDTESEELLRDLADLLGDGEWCQKNAARLRKDEEWSFDWETLSDQLKHHTRYVFYRVDPGPDDIFEPARSPHEILDTIGELISEQALLRTVEVGTKIIRARRHEASTHLSNVEDLGPPPTDKARYSNRMSPAGIPMFYGASREDTALNEVEGDDFATSAEFLTLQPFEVIDLTGVPRVPSIFDEQRNRLRSAIKFLSSFTDDLSKPIAKDGREHIEYVPTQVTTEYFRRVFRQTDDKPVRGIIYPSSRHEGGISWVLFFENQDCTQDDRSETDGKWLTMVTASVRRIDLKTRTAPPPVGRLF